MRYLGRWILFLSLSFPNAYGATKALDRSGIRSWVMAHSAAWQPTIEPQLNDQASDLVDTIRSGNLADMEKQGMMKAELASSPWTDSYWPTYAGQIANRYEDPAYSAAMIWKYNYEYLWRNMGKGKLSPAEKYDLLVGDENFTLTKKMILAGAPYADGEGKVETWFGLCHGWAAASMMLPRPAHSVTVQAPGGRKLTFSPSDLKALGTLLWANGAGDTKFIGGRCNDKVPGRDGENRETNPDCFDTNPATWHIAIVNQIGFSHRSFVMDQSAGYEVWNQPVLGYSYVYFNPKTGNPGYQLETSKALLKDVEDPYSAHRSPKAVFLVRVVMSVTYVTENTPSLAASDSADSDTHGLVNYSYDLELDQDNNIVGGEWRGSLHPDFLWVPEVQSRAYSEGDRWLDRQGDRGDWSGNGPVPASWRKGAKVSAASEQPLARLVERLYDLAK